MRRIAETGLKVLPVVSRTNIRELKGTISLDDILSAYAVGKVQSPTAETPPAAKPVALMAGILAVLAGLAIVGGFLSYHYRAERTNRTQHFYEQGNQLMQKGFYLEAVEQYRDALSISHQDKYRLALALALVEAGHMDEASIYLKELLRSQPASGPANLGMARVAAAEGRIDEAVAYYHHAIYGNWLENVAQHRVQARLELIQMLAKAGRRQQVQAELLSMLAARPDLPVKKQLAPLLLAYGLSKEAADVYRDFTQSDPQDEEAFEGLGEAEYALSDYKAPREALLAALRLNPNDTQAQKRLDACNQIMALDPTRRGLSTSERLRRTKELMAGVLEVFEKCSAPSPAGLKDAAHKLLANGAKRRPSGDEIEDNISLAEQLWTAGAKACPTVMPPPDAPLSKVMGRLMAR